jgi:hypothetical protein
MEDPGGPAPPIRGSKPRVLLITPRTLRMAALAPPCAARHLHFPVHWQLSHFLVLRGTCTSLCNGRFRRLNYKALEWAGRIELPKTWVATRRLTPFSHAHTYSELYQLSYESDFKYPQGWPMGFKPIMTGATSQRVNRFATATPVDTRG